jgi:hypothetical protein
MKEGVRKRVELLKLGSYATGKRQRTVIGMERECRNVRIGEVKEQEQFDATRALEGVELTYRLLSGWFDMAEWWELGRDFRVVSHALTQEPFFAFY